jgi:glutamate-1-semialdehyde 2,1-aminomutase
VGLILPEPGFLLALRRLCTAHGSVLIFDEVMTGFRVAPGGVQEKEGIRPDLTALGKIIGGGLPVGAFGGQAGILDYLAPDGPVYQAGTLSGNPLAMAAGIASLRLLKETDPYQSLDEKGRALCAAVKAAADHKGLPLQIPRIGSMFSLFFSPTVVHDYEEALKSDRDSFRKLFRYALDHGVYLPPSPFETCFLCAAHTDELIDKTASVLSDGIRAL